MTTTYSNPMWVTAQQMCAHYQVSRSTWWRWSIAPGFPTPIRFGRTVRWEFNEVETYLMAPVPPQEVPTYE